MDMSTLLKINPAGVFTAPLLPIGHVLAAEASRAAAGQLRDGNNVDAITQSNSHGIRARILAYGISTSTAVSTGWMVRRAGAAEISR
jgi:hypothetical protein